MKHIQCEFEAEALAAVIQSRWPERADDELRAHVASCAICSDVICVAGSIQDARQESPTRVSIPTSARAWRFAQLRARDEAIETAHWPIAASQIAALACAIGLLGAFFETIVLGFRSMAHSLGAGAREFANSILFAPGKHLLAEHGTILVMAAVTLVIPALVCVALLRDPR